MSQQSSLDNAKTVTYSDEKHRVEEAGGPLHFPKDDDLRHTDTMKQTILSAKAASDNEHKMTLLQGIKLYPKALAFSIIISTCIAMEGYDVSLVNNFYGFPQFNEKYGVKGDDGTYQIPATWQAGLSNGAACGEIIGLFINGFVSERFGYRYVSTQHLQIDYQAADLVLDCNGLPSTHRCVHRYIFHRPKCKRFARS